MSITIANTLDQPISTAIHPMAQTQDANPICQIFQISFRLAHFLSSNEKLERNTKKILRLYAVLDFCVSYLKERNLSDFEKSNLDRLISLLIFKMPSNDELANRCDQIFSSFYPNRHSTSAKSLPNFIDIIRKLKNSKMDTWALEMIDLYLLFLRNEEKIDPENIFKVLDITKDYLNSFQASLLPVPQEIYDQFLGRHLDFLALYLKHSFKRESSLYERLEKIIQELKYTTDNPDNLANPEFAQLLLHRAFLISRPEWISHLNPWEAISCLEVIQNRPEFSEDQINTQLQIIYLQYEQILRGTYSYNELDINANGAIINKKITDNQNVREELLLDSLRKIIKLQSTFKLSFSDRILASCLKASIQIQIAAQTKNGIVTLRNALTLIEEILQEVENAGAPISRTTEEHVLRCKIDWVLHCILAGESKDYAKALTIVNQWSSLPSSHPLFKIGYEIKNCIQSVQETPIHDAFTPQTISFIDRFKQLILSDYQTFFLKSLEFYNRENNELIKLSIKLNSDNLLTDCKLTAVNLIRKNDIKSAEQKLLKTFSYFIFISYCLFRDKYSSIKSSFPIPFSTVNPTHQPIIQLDFNDIQIKKLDLFLDTEKLNDYVHQHSSNPALRIFLNQQLDNILENVQFNILMQNKETGKINYENSLSSIQFTCYFLTAYFSELEKFEGQLIHCNTLLNINQSLIQTLGRNSLLKRIFLNKGKAKNKHLFSYTKHLTSIQNAEKILRNIFLDSTKFVVCLDNFYKEAFNVIEYAIPITRRAVDSDKNESTLLAKALHNCYKQHFRIVNHLNPSSEELNNIKIMLLASELMYLNSLPTEVENPIKTTQFFKKIPDTVAEFGQKYQLQAPLSGICEIPLVHLMTQKSYFLVQEQKIEAALKLYDELSAFSYKSKFNTKNTNDQSIENVRLSNIIFSDSKRIPIPDPSKLNKEFLLFSDDFRPIKKQTKYNEVDSEPFIPASSAPSTKKEVLEAAKSRLERETEKEKKKQARIPSSPTTTAADLITFVNSTDTKAPPPVDPIRLINKKAYKILQRIFIQNNEEEKGPWKDRSYRSDTVILRTDALKLIKALGGNYSESRGRGSHSVGHVPKLQNLESENLPKLELNGVEIGISDKEEGELLITMTKSVKFKYYQLSQFRDALIQQNINLDTVGPES